MGRTNRNSVTTLNKVCFTKLTIIGQFL